MADPGKYGLERTTQMPLFSNPIPLAEAMLDMIVADIWSHR